MGKAFNTNRTVDNDGAITWEITMNKYAPSVKFGFDHFNARVEFEKARYGESRDSVSKGGLAGLAEEEEVEFRRLFKEMSVDESGMELAELGNLFKRLGLQLNDEQVQQLFLHYDADH